MNLGMILIIIALCNPIFGFFTQFQRERGDAYSIVQLNGMSEAAPNSARLTNNLSMFYYGGLLNKFI